MWGFEKIPYDPCMAQLHSNSRPLSMSGPISSGQVPSLVRLLPRRIPLPILTRNAPTYPLNPFKLSDEKARARPKLV